MVDGTLTVYAGKQGTEWKDVNYRHGKWPSEVSMSTDVGKPKDT